VPETDDKQANQQINTMLQRNKTAKGWRIFRDTTSDCTIREGLSEKMTFKTRMTQKNESLAVQRPSAEAGMRLVGLRIDCSNTGAGRRSK
jgi:hypothetical protein